METWDNNKDFRFADTRIPKVESWGNAIEGYQITKAKIIKHVDVLSEFDSAMERKAFEEKWHCANISTIPTEYVLKAGLIIAEIQKNVIMRDIKRCSFDEEDNNFIDIEMIVNNNTYRLSVDILSGDTYMTHKEYIYHGSLHSIIHTINMM